MKLAALITLIVTSVCLCVSAQENSVERDALGELALQTQPIVTVQRFFGPELTAKVMALPGQSYVLKSPINIQQIRFLVGAGQRLQQGQAFAVIQGPEVHHFYSAYKTKQVLHEQEHALYQNQKSLYQKKAISEQTWLDVSNRYQQSKLALDEMKHFFELVVSVDDEHDALTLAAPIESIIQYSIGESLNTDSLIASFIPFTALRLKVSLPIARHLTPASVKVGSCALDIDFIENANSGFFETAWTQAIPQECHLTTGQMLSAQPQYSTRAYQVAQSAVFNLEGENHIFIKRPEGYLATPVSLLTSLNNDYILIAEDSLDGKEVLISSVSAVQGILQGLGL